MTADAVGGVWQYALDLAQGMRAYDTATTLCVMGPAPAPEQRAAARRIPGLELVWLDVPLDWTAAGPREALAAARQALAAARACNPTVVHLNSPILAAVAGWPAPVVAACHSCIATWWEAVRGRPLAREYRWHHRLVGTGLRNADALIAPTAAFARSIVRTYRLGRPPTVVYNGRRPCLRATLHGSRIPQGVFAFTAGRLWDEGKNLRTVDAAAGRIDLSLFAAGPLERLGGTPLRFRHIEALGRLTDGEVAEWLAAKPIFVSAALYEPFGLAALEAAEAACPLVLSDIPTFRELWDGAARFVSPRDDKEIAAVLAELAADGQARSALGAAARRRAKRYTAEVMAAKVQGVYGALLSEAPAAARREVAL
jgi:glycosyltransferase involved in cell wall biosynthesis